MFRVGQKVVCVDDSYTNLGRRHTLVKGTVYIVTAIGLTNVLDRDNLPCIKVAGEDGTYWQHRFRPIVSRKTDISSLEALLLPNAKILEGV